MRTEAESPDLSVNLRMQDIPADGSQASYADSGYINLPVVLRTLLRGIGIFPNSGERCLYLVIIFIFNIFLVYTLTVSLGVFAYSFVLTNKIRFTWLDSLSYLFVISTYYTLLYRKKNVSDALMQLNKIARHESTMLVNILTCVFCSVNFSLVLAYIIIYVSESDIYMTHLHVLVISGFISILMHHSFLNLFALMYFCLYRHCCSPIEGLTQEISLITPAAFEHSVQIRILKQKAAIDDVLSNMEEIFSGPSMLIIAGGFFSGLSAIRGYYLIQTNFVFYRVLAEIYFGLNSFFNMFFVLWIGKNLETKLLCLKREFFTKARMRLICTQNYSDPQINSDLFEKPNFVFSGWKLVTFKKINTFLFLIVIIVNISYLLL